jgi:ATP-dependent helicase/nuclease subunit A
VTQELPDATVREEIAGCLDRTLFVEAGAGSGKTQSLVSRVVATVLSTAQAVPLRHVAAVTFTEKAGAELRDRLRVAFESKLVDAEPGSEFADRATGALDDLDAAAIGTLHSFAERILGEHPVEAGLPPLIEVRDEVASGVAFDDRWTVLRTALLDDSGLTPALLLAMAAGMRLEDLRSMAREFTDNWDLLQTRILAAPAPGLPAVEVADLIAEARRLALLREHCTDDGDKFLAKLDALAGVGGTAGDSRGRPGPHWRPGGGRGPEVGPRPPGQLGRKRAGLPQGRVRRVRGAGRSIARRCRGRGAAPTGRPYLYRDA